MSRTQSAVSISAFRFFFENAGWVEGQKALGAFKLAKAEQWASDNGWSAQWDWDPDTDLSWMDEAERAKEHECLGCTLVDSDDEPNYYYHLGGIVDADDNYKRVVEAELALEAMHAELTDAPESLWAY